jgi:hypothetical protein
MNKVGFINDKDNLFSRFREHPLQFGLEGSDLGGDLCGAVFGCFPPEEYPVVLLPVNRHSRLKLPDVGRLRAVVGRLAKLVDPPEDARPLLA